MPNFSTRVCLLLMSTLLGYVMNAQTSTVTKSWTGSISVDNGNGNPPSVTFVSGVDFPAGHTIVAVSASVTFRKVDNTCASPGAGNPFHEETRFQVRGPGSLTTSNRRLINFNDFTGTTNTGTVTMSFPGTTALPAIPTTGTFVSNQSLSAYNGESPFGSWFIRARDNFAADPLCYFGYSITIEAEPPLPVELKDFTVIRNHSHQAELNWSTLSEINNDGFLVQRSLDGSNWETVEKIKKGNSNSNQEKKYHYLDRSTPTSDLFYRIVQQDLNGDQSPSRIRFIDKVEKRVTPKLYIKNNTIEQKINIQTSPKNQGYSGAEIYDRNGRLIKHIQPPTDIEKGVDWSIDVSDVSSGIYFLSITTAKGDRISNNFLINK